MLGAAFFIVSTVSFLRAYGMARTGVTEAGAP